jgi:hypothetical protein
MSSRLEYHQMVNRIAQRPIPALALLGAWLLFVAILTAAGQNNGNSGFAHAGSGAPPVSAHYSLAPGVTRSAPHPVSPGPIHPPSPPRNPGGRNNAFNLTNPGVYSYPYLYAVPIPYPVTEDVIDSAPADDHAEDNADYQGGPTVFDRRGSGPDSYLPPAPDETADASAEYAQPAPLVPVTPLPVTTLVFKDGRQLLVDNYAIVSQTLYDLTPGHARKTSLADLDLAATEKQNEDRGVTFQLPPSAPVN